MRAMSISSSTPRMTATPSSGSPNAVSVPESTTRDARGTAAMPLLVMRSVSIMNSCCPTVSSTPAACATKIDATPR